MISVGLEVWLYGHIVGRLDQTRSGAQFVASPDALDRYGVGSTVLSNALPLESAPSPVAATEAFFGGLLPEGPRLTSLLQLVPGLRRDNLVDILAHVGRDVAGALLIPGPETTAIGERLTDAEVAHEVANPSGYLAGGGSALAGVRPKVALARTAEGWHAARDGHPSTHMVKPVDPDAARSAHAEVWVMRLARAAGLIDYEVWFETFGDVPAVVVERFDRILDDGHVRRIHQEDCAQALGLPWGGDDKFGWSNPRSTLRAIAGLLDRDRTLFVTGVSDRERLLAYTTFRMIVGDTDAHAKNHALLHRPDGGTELAPFYDVTPGALYGGGVGPALLVGGERVLSAITSETLVAEAVSWGMDAGVAREVVTDTAERVRQRARDSQPDQSIAEHLPGYVTQAATALLDGRAVGLGLGEFPTLRPIPLA